MTVQEAAAQIRARKTNSRELVAESLQSIHRLQPRLNAFITVMDEQAQRRAEAMDRELESGYDRGPLHGIPVAVKDVFCTRGVRTTCGSLLFKDHIPDIDAAVVERLEQAGAVITGKTSLHELAYGITSNNPHFGAVHNPWAPDRVAGGSSGGSGSAVAAGLVFMAMGSDTGGSIRIPASFCGTVGLKPTTGRVSRYGVLPLDFTLDHMGPLTRSVRDAALTLEAIAGHDPRDDSSSRVPVAAYVPAQQAPLNSLRLGVPENFYFERVDPEVERSVRNVAEVAARLGARLISVRVPDIDAINTLGRVILLAEAAAVLHNHLKKKDRFGTDVLALLEQGAMIPAADYINAQRLRRLAVADFNRLWDQVDCLLTPTTPTTAPRLGQERIRLEGEEFDVRLLSTRFVRGVNVITAPALSLPCGLDSGGLPIGAQLLARPFGDAVLLQAAAALEDALGCHDMVPQSL